MSVVILTVAVWTSQIILAVAMMLVAYRLFIGPRAQDRILALDMLYVCAMLQLLVFGVRTGNAIFFEAALIIGMLGFVATVSLAKFLMRGEVIE
ncbi:K+/H+ antiporter subunit F [Rhizobium sp. EC-SD404]|uniref:K+/H+ antiporter subunit F n=1 Tax=Rhizobium sp. EC-SD404 TaxID=2038389 RepID=UPI00125BD7C5|nr:K+/H+ antiporter subunit F [Rhizobium sp. EC-SD404]VVT24335.1 putative K(+)/H(+) antiporter subunit F [Rhizobium sp. EC-SD404]